MPHDLMFAQYKMFNVHHGPERVQKICGHIITYMHRIGHDPWRQITMEQCQDALADIGVWNIDKLPDGNFDILLCDPIRFINWAKENSWLGKA